MIICDYFRSTPDRSWALSSCCGVTKGVIRLPEDDTFDLTSLSMLKDVCEKFRRHGIEPLIVEPLPNSLHDHIKLGDEMRDASIDQFIKLLGNLREVGITTVCFNFMAHYGWTRTSKELPERGGSFVTGFRLRDFEDDGAVLTAEKLRDNFDYFMKAVLPEAEKAGIRLALHPDDPPLDKLGKVARMFTNLAKIKSVIDRFDSPYFGVTFCQACYQLMGEDLENAIKTLSDKIFFIHFRNVRGTKTDFFETHHDNGDIDMAKTIRLYAKCCPNGARDIPIRVDHVPTLPFEMGNKDGYDALGRLFAIGYLKGLLDNNNKGDENMPEYAEENTRPETIVQSDKRRKVLLIGDSIRLGYCQTVKAELSDIADVRFPNDNCRFTQYTYVSLGQWRWIFENPEEVDVVLWNNGHWDAAHWDNDDESLNSPELYAEMTKRIEKRLRQYFPKAKLIFATTTPRNTAVSGPNPRSNEEIEHYNRIALGVIGDDVIVDDLNRFCHELGENIYADYCHLTPDDFKQLGLHVAGTIRKILE